MLLRFLIKLIDFDGDFRFLVLDVGSCDIDYINWILREIIDKIILELYLFFYMMNCIFFYVD